MTPTTRTTGTLVALVAAAVLVATACTSTSDTTATTPEGSTPGGTSTAGSTPGTAAPTAVPIVFNGQGNNLDAYAAEAPYESQRVITNAEDDPEGGLDINAQICFFPDGSNRFVAGEDTGQSEGDLQGWGIFQLEGDEVGDLSTTEVGKLVPTFQGSADNAENYGCGFLDDGRIVTSDIGNQALGPADGQLIVWFPPFDSEEVAYCKVDTRIATAQSIWVDDQDRVWVTSARPGEEGDTAAGVWRYDGPFPTGPTAADGCGQTDGTGAPLADDVPRTKVIAAGDNGLVSPAGLTPAPNGNLYVSSVFTGVINEYTTDGTFVRTILSPPDGEELGAEPFSTGTPLGLAVTPDGALWYADIGIVIGDDGDIGPGDATGSVRRIPFTGDDPGDPETIATGLDYPDGLGVWVP